ncbi:MAG: 3-oxoacyl-[acyl-carrier-protein] synthase III C-terminal domain-containing protein [Silvanigrellaceae bacterium]
MRTPIYVNEFRVVRPRFEKSQEEAIRWLAEAHAHAERMAGNPSGRSDMSVEFFEKLIGRFGCSPEKIAQRGHELDDFSHLDWDKMSVFNLNKSPGGQDMESRQRAYDKLVREKCEELYTPGEKLKKDLIHVSCTGYLSPSPLQRFAVERDAAASTRVFHAYHMGCYAALPSTRMAAALALQQGDAIRSSENAGVDVVHSELCTLHFNPLMHSPEQLVVQSLFADGFIRYRVGTTPAPKARSLRILAMNEEQIPQTAHAMTWLPLPWGMAMTLSRDVPALISSSVRGFIERLANEAGMSVQDVLPGLVYAIHPGGPKIIDHLQELLEAPDDKIEASRLILRKYGNMSSATLPHVWSEVLSNQEKYPVGTRILSMAFGPGLTIAGSLFEVADAG